MAYKFRRFEVNQLSKNFVFRNNNLFMKYHFRQCKNKVPASKLTNLTLKKPLHLKANCSKAKRRKKGSRNSIKSVDSLMHDDELIRKFFKMECSICDQLLDTHSEAKDHFRDVHNKNGYLVCCNKKYFKYYLVLQHCAWHLDSTAFK